ncbi:class I SAM-dependent methyltransferase [Nocardia sp. CS682]|uniref:class I SAM-dependent methyltransferase n=1 Tax=Nocardia sp. CS682 TaxID=1047172 RepID=UPI001F10EB1C|nr:class I SAM-dependent methyltransferase [Nocardia sp. CS682]
MSGAGPEAPMAGVAMTAVGVAVIRVRESDRPDRLYDDPLARDFVAAARRGFTETEDGAQRWTQLEALAGTSNSPLRQAVSTSSDSRSTKTPPSTANSVGWSAPGTTARTGSRAWVPTPRNG